MNEFDILAQIFNQKQQAGLGVLDPNAPQVQSPQQAAPQMAPQDVGAPLLAITRPKRNIMETVTKMTEPRQPYLDPYMSKAHQGIQAQKEGLQSWEEKLRAYTNKEDGPRDLMPLMLLSDALTGSKFAQMYQRPKTKEQREFEALGLEQKLQEQKNQLTDKENDIFKSQGMMSMQERKLAQMMGGQDKRADEKTMRIENNLFSEWQKNPLTKNSQDVATAYEKVNSAASDPSAAGDLSLIFGYMKMLDPGSTVREGEFATAQNAASVPSQVLNMYNKIISGERLNTNQRADFSKQARNVYSSQLAQQKRWDATIKARAEKLGLDPNSVVLGETLFGDAYSMPQSSGAQVSPQAAPASSKLSPEQFQRREELRAKFNKSGAR